MSSSVFMIYGRPESQSREFAELKSFDYGLLYAFDSQGLVEQEVLDECYRETYERPPEMKPCFGPFDSQDDLTRFAFKLCEKREVERSVILSPEEYNQVLEESHSREELLSKLGEAGRTVENLEGPKKGFLSMIFRS